MSNSWVAPLTLALSLLLRGPAASAQQQGVIHGRVTDEKGSAVQGVAVNAEPIDWRRRDSLVRYVETDEDGRFLIDRLDWGIYGIFTMKEGSGYPNTRRSFYSNDLFPTVAIASRSPVAEISIQLGPKAGTVTGSVTSSANGAPLNAAFKLSRAAAPENWLSSSVPAEYRILIPSSVEVWLEVSALGFKTWSPASPLVLQPGAELRLDIELEPMHEPNLQPSKFLVPRGFVGWLVLDYNLKSAQAAPTEGNLKVFRFTRTGLLETSSSGPERGAEDKYFYYSEDGTLQEIPTDYRNGKGMIWGQHEGTRDGVLSQFGFFIGTEDQYKKFQTRMSHPGPVPAQ